MDLPEWWPSDKPWIIGDCLEGMKNLPDKCIDVVLTDPPYGVKMGRKTEIGYSGKNTFKKTNWDDHIPSKEYFVEMFRVSKNQIIFGGNYYGLPKTRCVIVWDKGEGFKNRSFAECEIAWTSFNMSSKIYKHDPLSARDYTGKLHITQKPSVLFVDILKKFSKPGDVIFDPFLGSGTTLLACRKTGRVGLGYEIDHDYGGIIRKRSLEEIKPLEGYF